MVTYGVVDELRYNGLHELLVALVADQSDQNLKELTYQALKVHIVSILICLHTVLHSDAYTSAHSCMHCRSLHCTWQSATVLQDAHMPAVSFLQCLVIMFDLTAWLTKPQGICCRMSTCMLKLANKPYQAAAIGPAEQCCAACCCDGVGNCNKPLLSNPRHQLVICPTGISHLLGLRQYKSSIEMVTACFI